MSIDLDEATGKAAASIALQAALVAALITHDVITREDAATLTGAANAMIETMPGLSADARALAQAALRGFANSWLKTVTRN